MTYFKVGVMMILLAILLFWFVLTDAQAKCYCACINNQTTQICENSWDIEGYCAEGLWCSGGVE